MVQKVSEMTTDSVSKMSADECSQARTELTNTKNQLSGEVTLLQNAHDTVDAANKSLSSDVRDQAYKLYAGVPADKFAGSIKNRYVGSLSDWHDEIKEERKTHSGHLSDIQAEIDKRKTQITTFSGLIDAIDLKNKSN